MKYITTRQLSVELGKSSNTIYNYAKQLKIEAVRGGTEKNAPFLFTESQAEKIRKELNARS